MTPQPKANTPHSLAAVLAAFAAVYFIWGALGGESLNSRVFLSTATVVTAVVLITLSQRQKT